MTAPDRARPDRAGPAGAGGPTPTDPPPSERGGSGASSRLVAELAAVQVAHEELRTAEEEVRAQQEQITALLLQHDAERRWRGQVAALVPVGLCATDGTGSLVDVNPAFATFLGASPLRLRGKPLSVYLDAPDVPAFRGALRALGSAAAPEARLRVTLRPRHLPPARAHLFGFTEVADPRSSAARVQWVLVPEDAGGVVADPAAPDPARRAAEAASAAPALAGAESVSAEEVVGLACALAELSALPVGELDRQRLVSRMAALVRAAVPGAEWVSIAVGPPHEPLALGSDSAPAQDFDGRQARAGEGPGWDAHRTGSLVVTADLTADERWPRLAALAAGGGARSAVSVPVRDDSGTTGVLTALAARTGAFGPTARRIAELAAGVVAGVLANAAERESMQVLAANLERALSSRAVIDQAKGAVMVRLGVDADDAFARLVALSSRLNVKLRDLAGLVVEGHVDALLRAGGQHPDG